MALSPCAYSFPTIKSSTMKLMPSLVCIIAATTFAACNSGTNNASENKTEAPTTTATAAPPAGADVKTSTPVNGIVDGYLHLKNALTKDDGKKAAAAGTEILTAMGKVDSTTMNAAQKKAYADVADDVKENAEHISQNAGKIAHQREHFQMLSKDMEDLVKAFGGGQKLYKDFCPMAFDGKGASWLSEMKDIKNPYFGDEMLECGEVKEELK